MDDIQKATRRFREQNQRLGSLEAQFNDCLRRMGALLSYVERELGHQPELHKGLNDMQRALSAACQRNLQRQKAELTALAIKKMPRNSSTRGRA